MSNPTVGRLKTARLLKGFSLQDLADNLERAGLKISRQSLHKYEKNEVVPDSVIIDQIAKALEMPTSFFYKNKSVELSTPEFRKMKGLSAKEQARIIEVTKTRLERYLELEEILGVLKEFINPLDKLQPLQELDQVENAANTVRKIWNLGLAPINNSLELLEDNNIKIILLDSDEKFDGLQALVTTYNTPVIALNRKRLESLDRLRFTAIHELAHLLLPIKHLPEKLREQFCHRFAAAFLFPREVALKELGEKRHRISIHELGALKVSYGLSIQALIYRARDLSIISDSYFRQFMFYISNNGWRITEPVQYSGVEKSNRFEQLLFRALVEQVISPQKASELAGESIHSFNPIFTSTQTS